MTKLQIKKMSRKAQLQTMEMLWKALSSNVKEIHSPNWHKELLDATEKRFISGTEKPIEWSKAKAILRQNPEQIKKYLFK